MLISGETFIQRHGVRFYEIPISIQKTFPCGVILDLVQRSLIYLPKALIRIIKYGESDKYLAIPAFYGVPFLILHEPLTQPTCRRVTRQEHLGCLECLRCFPTNTGEHNICRSFRYLGCLINKYDRCFHRTETGEIQVSWKISHFFHHDYGFVPESYRSFYVVYAEILILFQSPFFHHFLNCYES